MFSISLYLEVHVINRDELYSDNVGISSRQANTDIIDASTLETAVLIHFSLVYCF